METAPDMPTRRSRTKVKTVNLMLRLPPDLHKAIGKSADQQDPPLSLNSEIVRLLRSALTDDEDKQEATAGLEAVRRQHKEIIARIREIEEAMSRKK